MELLEAAEKLDADKVKEILAGKGDVNASDDQGCTALSYAAWGKDLDDEEKTLEVMKALLEAGASLNTADKWEQPPLHHAVLNHKSRTVCLLIERGATLEYRTENGGTLLTVAVYYNFENVVGKALGSHLSTENVNTVDGYGNSALRYAMLQGRSKFIPLLLQSGASMYQDGKMLDFKKNDISQFLSKKIFIKKVKNSYGISNLADTQLILDYSFFFEPSNQPALRKSEMFVKYSGNSRAVDIENKTKKQMENYQVESQVVKDMVNLSPDHKDLLTHPMLKAYLFMKWRKVKSWYYAWMAFKVLSFLSFISMSYIKYGHKSLKESCWSSGSVENVRGDDSVGFCVLWSLFSLLTFAFGITEMFQMITGFRHWVYKEKNWLQMIIILLSVCSLILIWFPSYCQENRHIIGFLVPLMNFEILYELGHEPNLAKYILMFKKVSKTFLKYAMVYVSLVISCAFGFFIMLPTTDDEKEFPTGLDTMIPKTIVMFIGEQEFMNIPFSKSPFFLFLEHIFFILFIFFLVIILMNLMNALAVVDAKEILEEAEEEMLSDLLNSVHWWDSAPSYIQKVVGSMEILSAQTPFLSFLPFRANQGKEFKSVDEIEISSENMKETVVWNKHCYITKDIMNAALQICNE